MNRKLVFFTIVAVLIISISAFVFRSWLEAHDDRMALQATLDSQKQLIVAADQREQQRQQDLKSTLAQIDELKRQAQTPQQILHDLPQYLPLPQPIQLITAQAPQQGSAKSAEQGTAPP